MGVSKKKQATVFQVPLDALIRGHLTPTQYVFCDIVLNNRWQAINQYYKEFGGFPREELRDLGARGYVVYKNPDLPKETRDLSNNLLVTQLFEDLLFGTDTGGEQVSDTSLLVDDDTAFNELFEAYPPYIDLGNGSKAPGRTIAFEYGAERYSLATKGKREMHLHILDLLEWGKQHGLITMGLGKFIESRQWLSLEAARHSGDVTDYGAFNNDI